VNNNTSEVMKALQNFGFKFEIWDYKIENFQYTIILQVVYENYGFSESVWNSK
jgi:hypothetical protein